MFLTSLCSKRVEKGKFQPVNRLLPRVGCLGTYNAVNLSRHDNVRLIILILQSPALLPFWCQIEAISKFRTFSFISFNLLIVFFIHFILHIIRLRLVNLSIFAYAC